MNIGPVHIPPGDENPSAYIIAEIGVNHDGSVERALELTHAAAVAGADAVKLQHFRTELLMSRAAMTAAYQAAAGETDPIAMLRRLELPLEGMARVVDLAHELGLHAIVTVFSTPLVGEARSLEFDAYKTASPDVVNRPLLDALAAAGKPMIVSTGAADIEEVRRAVRWLGGVRKELALLQCVSCYPTRPEDASIGAIADLANQTGLPIGYSDHTTGTDTGAIAALAGAVILEKHLTHDRAASGPDHAASLDPDGFREYASLARAAAAERRADGGAWRSDPRLGPPSKRVLACERDVRLVSRQSVVSARPLAPGTVLARADLAIKRPGTGIEPYHLSDLVGRTVERPIEADAPLTWEDLA